VAAWPIREDGERLASGLLPYGSNLTLARPGTGRRRSSSTRWRCCRGEARRSTRLILLARHTVPPPVPRNRWTLWDTVDAGRCFARSNWEHERGCPRMGFRRSKVRILSPRPVPSLCSSWPPSRTAMHVQDGDAHRRPSVPTCRRAQTLPSPPPLGAPRGSLHHAIAHRRTPGSSAPGVALFPLGGGEWRSASAIASSAA
jgi:hypothetical protein